MKFFITIFLLIGSAIGTITIKDKFEDCNIPIEVIDHVELNNGAETWMLSQEEGMPELLNYPVLREIKKGRFNRYPIPSNAKLVTIGLIVIDNIPPQLYPSFGIVSDEEAQRFWMFLYSENIWVLGDATLCNVFEIDLYPDESANTQYALVA